MLEKFVRSKAYYVCSILVSLFLLISSFSYTGYKFYTLFIVCVVSIILTIYNMYKRGVFKWKKNR